MTNCKACQGNKKIHLSYPGKNNTLGLQTIEVCNQCGYGEAFPKKTQEELDQFYQSGQYWHDVADSVPMRVHQLNQAFYRVKRIKPYIDLNRPLVVLDIGSGSGYILDWLKKEFSENQFVYEYIEPDDKASEQLKSRNPSITSKRLREMPSEPLYDVIFMNHVLEHLSDPFSFLGLVSHSLKENGHIYIETPNSDYNFKADVFPHTLFFGINTYPYLTKDLPLKLIDSKSFGRKESMKTNKLIIKFWNRFITFCLGRSCQFGLGRIARFFNSVFYDYKKSRDGIWNYVIFKKITN